MDTSTAKIWERFNLRNFLVQKSNKTMAAIHCKIKETGEYVVRISDCNKSIRLHGNLNDPEDVNEALEKVRTIRESLNVFEDELLKRINQ
jgi:pyridoxal biosynthesis lyase PdxS